MKTFPIIRMALGSLSANKLRASLALLGIVIGITAVITLMSVGRGVQELIVTGLESFGTNLVLVIPDTTVDWEDMTPLTYSDALALMDNENAPSIEAVALERNLNLRVVSPEEDSNANIVGVLETHGSVRNLDVD